MCARHLRRLLLVLDKRASRHVGRLLLGLHGLSPAWRAIFISAEAQHAEL